MQRPEAVCLGTAILAGVAIGKYRNVADAVAQLVKAAETIAPDPALAESYKAQVEQYPTCRATVWRLSFWRSVSSP